MILRNGDKITGSLESLANGVYTIVTASGTLRIAASEIREIRDVGAVNPAPVRVIRSRR